MAATTWPEFPSSWGRMLDAVWGFLADPPPGVAPHGHNVMLYKDDVPNVEVGVQVAGTFEPTGEVVASTLPGGLVATARAGSIEALGDTHDSVRRWCAAHGHRLSGPRWRSTATPTLHREGSRWTCSGPSSRPAPDVAAGLRAAGTPLAVVAARSRASR